MNLIEVYFFILNLEIINNFIRLIKLNKEIFYVLFHLFYYLILWILVEIILVKLLHNI